MVPQQLPVLYQFGVLVNAFGDGCPASLSNKAIESQRVAEVISHDS